MAKAIVFQEAADVKAAHAVVADHNRFSLRIELPQAQLDAAHRPQQHPVQVATFVFPAFAHIQEEGCRALWVVQPGFEFGGAQLLHVQKTKRSGSAAFTRDLLTVSNRATPRQTGEAVQVKSVAAIAGPSPTMAKRRPPGLRRFR